MIITDIHWFSWSSTDWIAQIHVYAYNHATLFLKYSHWLREPEWIKLIQVERSHLQLSARFSATLPTIFQPVADVTSRRRLRSSSSSVLLLPVTPRIIIIGDRAFAVAGRRAWNDLPDFITDCSSSRSLKQYLKSDLYI